MQKSEWKQFTCFCPWCGTKVLAAKDAAGIVKIECNGCNSFLVVTKKSRRRMNIGVFAQPPLVDTTDNKQKNDEDLIPA